VNQVEYAKLYTVEGENLPEIPWDIYPRPQMKRDSFLCLNGKWEFSANGGELEEIIVPFAPESLLSGIHRDMGAVPKLYYRKKFSLPNGFMRERVLLHFGAVDQIAKVKLNSKFIGEHIGGYEAFSFDVTEFIQAENVLEVEVVDELDKKVLPYGKQCRKRGGMWYTPVSGIWQTVWMESVCENYIKKLRIDVESERVKITTDGVCDGLVKVYTENGMVEAELRDGAAVVNIDSPRMWSSEDPYLYEFTVTSGDDKVESYFAMRTLEIKTIGEYPRLCLNGKPYFFNGILDQGYFSDGIYTPASPINYTNDILAMKSLGFNMLRKHIKVEAEHFYYECDRLGMVVFQDMVNNGDYSFIRDTALPTVGLKKLNDKWLHRDEETRAAFVNGMKSVVNQLYNHPCICYWTVFNEGWGQFCSDEMYHELKNLDTSRFVDSTSGWFKNNNSDVESLHVYFKPVKLDKSDRPIVLSEFGGYVYKVKDHSFNADKTYGYKLFEDRDEFERVLVKLYEDEVLSNVDKGLCGAVYTQVSDVEDETNGLLTYDRRVLKVDRSRLLGVFEKLKNF